MTAAAKQHDAKAATGQDIPAPPSREPAPTPLETSAADFTFTPAGEDSAAAPEAAVVAETAGEDTVSGLPVTWSDEQVALGRRICASRGGDGEAVTCLEEVLPSNATQKQVDQAKARLTARLTAE